LLLVVDIDDADCLPVAAGMLLALIEGLLLIWLLLFLIVLLL